MLSFYTCSTCQQSIETANFCYWCGAPICRTCTSVISLPQDTAATVCLDCLVDKTTAASPSPSDETMLAIMVDASLSGHDLGPWQFDDQTNGWQAACRLCTRTVWVNSKGLQYSLLDNSCPFSDG